MRGLEQFSHLWLSSIFTRPANWAVPMVQPPAWAATKAWRIASSPFRPNPIGLSVVRNLGTQTIKSQLLRVEALIWSMRPPSWISSLISPMQMRSSGRSGFASDKPGACWDVNFTDSALDALSRYQSTYPNLKAFIISVLQQDRSPGGHAAKTTNNMEWHFTT